MALQEIERKFLVKDEAFKKEAYKVYKIAQGYLNSDPERSVRIRIRDKKAYLTIKGLSSKDGLKRFEWEKEIDLEEGRVLMNLCEPTVIDKNRYLVKSGEHTFEIDEFFGDNKDLVIAEVELEEINESFEKPDWLSQEVTGDSKYYNSQLSKNPFKDWC